MSNILTTPEQPTIMPVTQFLTPISHDRAQALSANHANKMLRKEVCLNTLAVYAVHYYLLDECDLWSEPEASHSTHPVYQMLDAAAGLTLPRDLYIPEVGRIDCCALLPNQTEITIPQENIAQTVAYVAVRFKPDTLQEVELLGFFRSFDPSDPYPVVEIGDTDVGWQPMAALEAYLEERYKLQQFKNSDAPTIQHLQNLGFIESGNEDELSDDHDLDILWARFCYTYRQEREFAKDNFRAILQHRTEMLQKSKDLATADRDSDAAAKDAELEQVIEQVVNDLVTKFGEIFAA